MKFMQTKGTICYKNKLGIEFHICEIDYYLYEDESFKYIFRPNFGVISLLDNDNQFQGIPGLDLSLKEENYIRDNMVPTFISERTPSLNRDDLYDLLEKVDLDYLNPVEYLIRTNDVYSGDNLYVIKYEESKSIILEEALTKNNTYGILKFTIENIAKGNVVNLKDGTSLNNKELFNTLLFLYEKSLETKRTFKKSGNYKGRKPIEVDYLLFNEQLEKVNNKQITARKAASNLGISIDKFYRTKKVLQK